MVLETLRPCPNLIIKKNENYFNEKWLGNVCDFVEEHEKRKTARGLFHFAIQCAYACYFVMNPIKAADTVSRNSFY
jgi:hypothetical protein